MKKINDFCKKYEMVLNMFFIILMLIFFLYSVIFMDNRLKRVEDILEHVEIVQTVVED